MTGTPKASQAAITAVQEAIRAHGEFITWTKGAKHTLCRCQQGGWMTWAEHRAHQAQAAADAAAPHNAAQALRDWIDGWPTTPGDGTFLANVARDGRARADRIEAGQ